MINVKKRYVIIGLLAASLAARSQPTETSYKKRRLSQSEVQLLFSYYTQDNDHSAVTGGTGTEDLQVYVTQLNYDVTKDSVDHFSFDGGVDIITSASTDNIDFVMSSASRVDARTHMRIGYDRRLPDKGFSVGGKTGFSIESDYLSIGNELSMARSNRIRTREWLLGLQFFYDDLRWGRFDSGKPQELIYPSELRYKEWFDHYRRNSYNLYFSYAWVLDRRTSFSISPSVSYQSGLLSTPFHRVYFTDDTKRVENLPDHRFKFPLGFQLNRFVGSRTVLRTNYRFYVDDFGVMAHTLNLEAALKVSHDVTITPLIRVHRQHGSAYFKPYGEHDPDSEYQTSDYDLSTFTSVKPGVALRFAPFATAKRFKAVEVRYVYYRRSDGLESHMITTYFDFSHEKRKDW